MEKEIKRPRQKNPPDGRCCQTGCFDCPYGYSENSEIDPSYPAELQGEGRRDDWIEGDKNKDY